MIFYKDGPISSEIILSLTRGEAPKGSTWETLGLTRFFLAMIVVAKHLHYFGFRDPLFTRLLGLGAFVAVLCFLIISGYSIAHSISKRSDGFYRRRLLRIYPLYAVAVIAPVLAHACRGHLPPHEIPRGFANLLFLQTFVVSPIELNAAVWTLAVEAACYLLAPVFLKVRTPQLLAIAGVSLLAFVLYPTFGDRYYAGLSYGLPLLLLGWSWLAGFLYYRHRHDPRSAIILILGLMTALSINDLFNTRNFLLTVAVTLAALLLGHQINLPAIGRRVMLYCGDLSYPLYLFHFPVFYLCTGVLHLRSPYALVLIALSTAAIGVAGDGVVRRPFEALLNSVCSQTGRCTAYLKA